MTRPRRLPALLVATVLLASSAGVAGCGQTGDAPAPSTAATSAAVRSYAASVAAVTEQTRARLAQIASSSDYRTPKAAQSSTQAYATTIREAAGQLAKTKVPAGVVAQHRALVELYVATANHMDGLAGKFATANGVSALAAQAQALSAEVQQYSSQEQGLRTAIEAALARTGAPPAATPAIQPTSDPG